MLFDKNVETLNTFVSDFGILKTFLISDHEKFEHGLNLGVSIMNFTNSKMDSGRFALGFHDEINSISYYNKITSETQLPVIARYGICYHCQYSPIPFEALNVFQGIVHLVYQDIINSKYYSTYKAGLEIQLFEAIAFRGGYYNRKKNDHGVNIFAGRIEEFTYGWGLQLPFIKLTENKIRLIVRIDYVSLPQMPANELVPDWGKCNSFNLSLNYLFK